ncbi:hypothetical protein [Armatimonas sp.]|uniref:hypothetical protein n=1 Tax=Armatimonas sp. TaxID=1872638 RepID=UPI0037524C0C
MNKVAVLDYLKSIDGKPSLQTDEIFKRVGKYPGLWTWDMQDLTRDFAEYNTGARYWEIFAFDVYDQGFNQSWYDYILPIIGNKPMAIGECDRLPTPSYSGSSRQSSGKLPR